MILCVACEFKLKPNEDADQAMHVEVQRYDRLQSRYLTTGDFSALQQMNTGYPMETRTLIEDMLRLGDVNDPEINTKFLNFYQDTLLQTIISDAELQYANVDDLNHEFSMAFERLSTLLPDIEVPVIYAQIGALAQSVVIGDKMIGISLDKYLGKDYPAYLKYYPANQRKSMTRANIVPDCLVFYLLSVYPMPNFDSRSQEEKDLHMAKVMWTVNKVLGRQFFNSQYVKTIEHYMYHHPKFSVDALLQNNDYSLFKK
ncbi:MAG: gliding motility protein GldB [Prevotella sp.]|nr:gliding motility protein GldB [Prevotella sp.]